MGEHGLNGWSGFGTATVGIDPNTFEVLNGHPNKIPTDKILGGVVQNCLASFNVQPNIYIPPLSSVHIQYTRILHSLAGGLSCLAGCCKCTGLNVAFCTQITQSFCIHTYHSKQTSPQHQRELKTRVFVWSANKFCCTSVSDCLRNRNDLLQGRLQSDFLQGIAVKSAVGGRCCPGAGVWTRYWPPVNSV